MLKDNNRKLYSIKAIIIYKNFNNITQTYKKT